ncbi:MAG TPA: hypothetical protein VIJ28_21985 [Chloroflexota bacterium]|jgi:hypothetical protein
MRRHSIPRWFRTALVFLASLQAARAGSVEARDLGLSHVERATAASAPRDPASSMGARLPEIRPLSLRIQLAEPASPILGARDTSGAKSAPQAAPVSACALMLRSPEGHADQAPAIWPEARCHFALQPGARWARAPNAVSTGN